MLEDLGTCASCNKDFPMYACKSCGYKICEGCRTKLMKLEEEELRKVKISCSDCRTVMLKISKLERECQNCGKVIWLEAPPHCPHCKGVIISNAKAKKYVKPVIF